MRLIDGVGAGKLPFDGSYHLTADIRLKRLQLNSVEQHFQYLLSESSMLFFCKFITECLKHKGFKHPARKGKFYLDVCSGR